MRAVMLLLLGLALAGCAGRPDCPLERVADVPLRLVANVPLVPVEINGRPAALVLDTGSDSTVLSRAAAARLGVAAEAGAVPGGGAGGLARLGVARIAGGSIGGAALPPGRVLLSDAMGPPLDGVLGIDALVGFELDLDMPARRLVLYRARACAGVRPGWEVPWVEIPAAQKPGAGHLYLGVRLNNEPLRGMLDTGASASVVSLQGAEDAGVTRRALAAAPASRGVAFGPDGVLVRTVRFRSLEVGGATLDGPALSVVDLPAFVGDMLVGEDWIGRQRLWIAFRLGRVFAAR